MNESRVTVVVCGADGPGSAGGRVRRGSRKIARARARGNEEVARHRSRRQGGKEARTAREGDRVSGGAGEGKDWGTAVIVASVSPRKNVNMGHRWRCKCGYAEQRACVSAYVCMWGGRRISAFPALGGGGNSESPGEGDPGGWPGAGDRRIRRLLFLRMGRDRRGDRLRLEVSAPQRFPLLCCFFFRLSGLENSFALARATTFSLVPSQFRVLSPLTLLVHLTPLWLRYSWQSQCLRVSSVFV